MRKTPVTSPVLNTVITEHKTIIKLPAEIAQINLISPNEIEVITVIKKQVYSEQENSPIGLDPWILD